MPKQLKLPQSPNVIVRDNFIVICFIDGSETIWGEETSHIEALNIARELEIELRAVNFIKSQIKNFIKEIGEILYSIDADETLLLSIIKDGHALVFSNNDFSTIKALKLDDKPEIKQIIIEKMDDSYVV